MVQAQGPHGTRWNDASSDEVSRASSQHLAKHVLVADLLQTLLLRLNRIAYILLGFALLLAFIVVASTAFTDVPMSIATYAVATAVSILPASLIAVVSLTLANATRELARRNALVRRMDAVEALGAVTDICSDKTGTITVGKMGASRSLRSLACLAAFC